MSYVKTNQHEQTQYDLRQPEIVMDPSRLGAMHQTRISFVRSLIRRMFREQWSLSVVKWQLCHHGFGEVIYQLTTATQVYHLVIFSNEIEDDDRIDRVIANKWDVTFALVMGEITESLLSQLKNNVPLQEAGRNTAQVIVLARANKSVRVFEHVVDSLASGSQPNADVLVEVGYILRTTACYGNGKFGIADFETLKNNPDFNVTFSAQMCAVYLLRQFSLDWVNYLAKEKGGQKAIALDKNIQRYLGIGNATGLGMAPYLINHPKVVDKWLSQREKAIALVGAQEVSKSNTQLLKALLQRASKHLQQIVTIDENQRALNIQATLDLDEIIKFTEYTRNQSIQWKRQIEYNLKFSLEAQEIFIACLLECFPEIVDPFEEDMNANEMLTLPAWLTINQIIELIQVRYRWAIDIDFSQEEHQYWFWFRSEDKEEPRLGIRGIDAGAEKELPLDIARQVNQFYQALIVEDDKKRLAEFLLANPAYSGIARRVWSMGECDMGEIQMNVLTKQTMPINLLRCKLASFGATKFDPRSDRWVRVTLFQGAPLMEELHPNEWLFPILPESVSNVQL
jgi:hypothetical protein